MSLGNELISLAQRINDTTDSVTNELVERENAIRDLKFGFHAWVPKPIICERYQSENPEFGPPIENVKYFYLGWARLSKLGWGFALREELHEIVDFDEDGFPLETKEKFSSIQPLMRMDRSKRLSAFEYLDALEKEIASEGNKLLEKIDSIRSKREAKALDELNQQAAEAGF